MTWFWVHGVLFRYDGEHLYSAKGVQLSGKYRHFRCYEIGRTLQVARVIWEGIVGPIPEGHEIDHEDGNHLNNRLTNLRRVTKSVNLKNKGGYSTKSGVPGVSIYYTASGETRYRAGIRNPQISKVFTTLQEAIDFLEEVHREHGFHKNHRHR